MICPDFNLYRVGIVSDGMTRRSEVFNAIDKLSPRITAGKVVEVNFTFSRKFCIVHGVSLLADVATLGDIHRSTSAFKCDYFSCRT